MDEHRAMLAQAKAEAARVVEAALAKAEEHREELIAKANAEAAAILERAKAEIRQEQAKAVEQLRTQIASLSVAAAEKLLARSITAADQDKILNRSWRSWILAYESTAAKRYAEALMPSPGNMRSRNFSNNWKPWPQFGG